MAKKRGRKKVEFAKTWNNKTQVWDNKESFDIIDDKVLIEDECADGDTDRIAIINVDEVEDEPKPKPKAITYGSEDDIYNFDDADNRMCSFYGY